MKNFYEKDDFKFLRNLTSKQFVDVAATAYDNFLQNLSIVQTKKLELFNSSNYIKYFMVFLKFVSEQTTTPPYELYNIHCADFNISERNYQKHPIDLEIEQINKYIEPGKHQQFNDVLFLLESLQVPIVTCGYIHYKDEARITLHKHDENFTVIHILLEDIQGGELNVKVNNELGQLTKKGDFLMFDPYELHEAWLTGKQAKTISLGLLKNTYEHY